MKRRVTVAALVFGSLGLVASQAFAGIYYQAVTKAEGGRGAEMQNVSVKAWASDDKSKVEFENSGNPMMGQGDYMITTDGGKTVYMVNPKDKSYFKWDMDQMLQLAGGAGKMVNMTVANHKVEKLAEEPDGVILGMPTIHYKFHTSYDMEMKIMGFGSKAHIDTVQEAWTAPKLVEAALGLWLKKTPPKTGNEELDKLINGEMSKMQGFPLKMITTTTHTDSKGKSTTTTTTMEVTEFTPQVVPDSTFVIPADYKETNIFGAGGEGEGQQQGQPENPFLKMLGGKKKPTPNS